MICNAEFKSNCIFKQSSFMLGNNTYLLSYVKPGSEYHVVVMIFLGWLIIRLLSSWNLLLWSLQGKSLQKEIQFPITPCSHSNMTLFLMFSLIHEGNKSRLNFLYKKQWCFSQLLTPILLIPFTTLLEVKELYHYIYHHQHNCVAILFNVSSLQEFRFQSCTHLEI